MFELLEKCFVIVLFLSFRRWSRPRVLGTRVLGKCAAERPLAAPPAARSANAIVNKNVAQPIAANQPLRQSLEFDGVFRKIRGALARCVVRVVPAARPARCETRFFHRMFSHLENAFFLLDFLFYILCARTRVCAHVCVRRERVSFRGAARSALSCFY